MDYLQIDRHNTLTDELRSSVLLSHSDFLSVEESYQQNENELIMNKYPGMENGLQIFKINRKYLKSQISLTLLIVLNFILQIVYFELEIKKKAKESQIVQWTLLINCIGLLIASWNRYNIRQELSKGRKQSKGNINYFILEFLILLIQPYPFFQNVNTQRRGHNGQQLEPLVFNHFILLFSISKFVFLARGIFHLFTKYSNPRSYRICKFYSIETNYLFHLRCLFRDYPALLMSLFYLICLFVFAYGYRICQINVNPAAKMEHFDNAIWLASLGMTSVGYGDLAPITLIGSIISLIGSFVGVIANSLFVLSITLNLQMNYREERSLIILKRIEIKSQIKEKSAKFLRLCLWRKWNEHKNCIKILMCPQERQLMRQLRNLRESCKTIAKQSARFEEAMIQQFENINAHLLQLTQNEQKLVDLVADKQAVMKGVARRMFSKNMGKSMFMDKINQVQSKIVNIGDQCYQNDDKNVERSKSKSKRKDSAFRKTCLM